MREGEKKSKKEEDSDKSWNGNERQNYEQVKAVGALRIIAKRVKHARIKQSVFLPSDSKKTPIKSLIYYFK